MKKIIAFFVIFITVMAIYLSINIELNMNIRYWIKQHLEKDMVTPTSSSVILATNEEILESRLAAEIAIEENAFYVPVDWLKKMGFTFHYDEGLDQLNLVGYGYFLRISENGSVIINDDISNELINLVNSSGVRYIDISALLSLDKQGVIPYDTMQNSDVLTWVLYFDDGEFGNANVLETKGAFIEADDAANEGIRPEFVRIKSILNGDDLSQITSFGDSVFAYLKDTSVYYVLTEEGNLGYIKMDSIDIRQEGSKIGDDSETEEVETDNPEIRLVWEYVYRKTPNPSTITNLTGINVLSPTWYELIDAEGNFSDKSSSAYTNWVHQQGMEIWPLLSNGFDPDLTHEFLKSADSRQHLINQVVELIITMKYDGINIDFEYVYLEDKDTLSNFINELAWYLAPYDVTLSMDVTVIAESDNWSKFYDRKVLGQIVDYLIVMTYDEHWDSSPISGPVASYDWVEAGLVRITTLVPPEKIIMGIPLYTRVWEETVDSSAQGGVNVSANAIGIRAQNDLIEEKSLELTWLDEDRLYYVTYIEDDIVYKIWVENLETILEKINLSRQLSLGGYAFWRRGLEDETFYEDLKSAIE